MPTTYPNILTDVSALVAANATSYAAAAARKIRRRFVHLEGDPSTFCIISPQGWKTAEEGFEGKVVIDFFVGVLFLYPGNMQLETGLTAILDEIDAARRGLHVTSLSTATSVFDSGIDLNPPFDLSALDANLDYLPMLLTYRSNESRN